MCTSVDERLQSLFLSLSSSGILVKAISLHSLCMPPPHLILSNTLSHVHCWSLFLPSYFILSLKYHWSFTPSPAQSLGFRVVLTHRPTETLTMNQFYPFLCSICRTRLFSFSTLICNPSYESCQSKMTLIILNSIFLKYN